MAPTSRRTQSDTECDGAEHCQADNAFHPVGDGPAEHSHGAQPGTSNSHELHTAAAETAAAMQHWDISDPPRTRPRNHHAAVATSKSQHGAPAEGFANDGTSAASDMSEASTSDGDDHSEDTPPTRKGRGVRRSTLVAKAKGSHGKQDKDLKSRKDKAMKVTANGKSEHELMLLDPKRLKRIMANRLSAAKSKERKAKYTSELEAKMSSMEADKEVMEARLEGLQADSTELGRYNKDMSNEVLQLQVQLTQILEQNKQRLERLHAMQAALGMERRIPAVKLPPNAMVPVREIPDLRVPPSPADTPVLETMNTTHQLRLPSNSGIPGSTGSISALAGTASSGSGAPSGPQALASMTPMTPMSSISAMGPMDPLRAMAPIRAAAAAAPLKQDTDGLPQLPGHMHPQALALHSASHPHDVLPMLSPSTQPVQPSIFMSAGVRRSCTGAALGAPMPSGADVYSAQLVEEPRLRPLSGFSPGVTPPGSYMPQMAVPTQLQALQAIAPTGTTGLDMSPEEQTGYRQVVTTGVARQDSGRRNISSGLGSGSLLRT
mmetsp:Transcript_30610/g.67789  ORF Transcript_30610/g.67789 Transcript_30610/m.67789 type:complete len:548 (+) Transcript_30610:300-1943(+)